MPETDTIPVSASVASTGLGIRYIGDYAYAFSGPVQNAGTGSASTTLLNFTSGSGIIVGTVDFTNTNPAGHDTYLDIFFNSVAISTTKEANAALVPWRFHILIPPFY